MAIERATFLNSKRTLLVNDYDLSSFELFLTGGAGGVLFSSLGAKTEFSITGTTSPSVSKGSAIVVCTRATSTPITNQKIAVRYALGSTKAFTGAVNGSKIYIEINQALVNDPTLIEDAPGSTDYAMGLNIGVMSMSLSYPVTNSYIPLYEYNGSAWIDKREYPTMDGRLLVLDSLTGDIVTTGDIEGDNITGNRVKSSYIATEDDDVINKECLDEAFAALGGSIPHATQEDFGTIKMLADADAPTLTNTTDCPSIAQIASLFFHKVKIISVTRGNENDPETVTINHNMGKAPKFAIGFSNIPSNASSRGTIIGLRDGTNQYANSMSGTGRSNQSSFFQVEGSGGGYVNSGVISGVNTTSISITWTRSGSSGGTPQSMTGYILLVA